MKIMKLSILVEDVGSTGREVVLTLTPFGALIRIEIEGHAYELAAEDFYAAVKVLETEAKNVEILNRQPRLKLIKSDQPEKSE